MQIVVKEKDSVMMLEAVRLAMRGFGRTSPNPMVGALVARDGVILGKGSHLRAGLPHAEINAINDAGGASECAGADLYVTLEPCSTFGRTPPCTDEIIKAGISRVVIGTLDPNPSHSGRALGLLKKAGIEVVLGVEEQKCRRLNEAFSHWIVTGRPFVLLKLATTLDGRIATSGGGSRWITGEVARRRVRHLRKWSDAIMV
ncbi:MAG: bifunctional diaminohydroxyphosphoribosylaminopyrimidine deaminase/5-amino-6-(5-phosphoribosylamino)uracil reductase RibD, partial [Victivallales bacterium]|nr:bifunctional diaminohydroxyphosphoribosylaminopyrimidine deaminase/5-amino-6-(5-phosphoribosylamino)uracil reductase RibD [Victivallales bacterium]